MEIYDRCVCPRACCVAVRLLYRTRAKLARSIVSYCLINVWLETGREPCNDLIRRVETDSDGRLIADWGESPRPMAPRDVEQAGPQRRDPCAAICQARAELLDTVFVRCRSSASSPRCDLRCVAEHVHEGAEQPMVPVACRRHAPAAGSRRQRASARRGARPRSRGDVRALSRHQRRERGQVPSLAGSRRPTSCRR